jgi:hypothetical protein
MAEAIYDIQERREERRYRSPEGLFRVENAESRISIGDLLDISASGLSFVYLADVDAIEESTQLNIVSASGEVYIEQVTYQSRNDFDYIRNYPFDAYRMRRRGVSFAGLTEAHKSALAVLIKAIHR